MDRQYIHLAIIMDGNGRWAQARNLPRVVGHRQGAKTVRKTVESAREIGIRTLTLYAFSADNWSRPTAEVQNILSLLRRYLVQETDQCVKHGIRMTVIGRRDRLAPELVHTIAQAETRTRHCGDMNLRLAVDYSATHAIAATAARLKAAKPPSNAQFSAALARTIHSPADCQPVDLLIRTGGEQRLSDFLLWECAYAELLFIPTLWPDFGPRELHSALCEYSRRDRRFGALSLERRVV